MKPTTVKKMPTRKKAALWLMIAPTALFISGFFLFALVNWALSTSATPATDGQLFGNASILQSIINVILFSVTALSIVAWLPAMITGIVLLATKK